ncbi:helix-turn-helix domain-containing protein [Lipingzhangella sp. LS1_29]|uniref:Helix-turn-helix domain-containing protein n=1 Tax=Lipingzhangella rawalii TaxID=2055835 RepID=A0ABU2H8U0_9ACTN|nr:helix-turn-helix domain-containing protein [Lipingzhangella rawalii]MDS1271722.1 helix-turn-helix domain-containing protein [Lipingzhangella rawalii]
MFTHADRHPVAVLVRPHLLPVELGIVHQILGQVTSAQGAPLYEVRTCTPIPGDLVTASDLVLPVTTGPELLPHADTVIVPAAYGNDPARHHGRLTPELAHALSRIRPGTRIASICSGSFVLAAAGLLDDRRATTHWKASADFRRLFPTVRLDPTALFTEDGTILTSGGVASGIDLCLHMVRTDYGPDPATDIARITVVPPHRAGDQAQYVPPRPVETDTSSTAAARTWARQHLADHLTLADLAAQAAMSVRTFTRRFRADTGLSVTQWLTQQRLDHARALLETTDLPVDRIAVDAGFGTASSLRQHFSTQLGMSPRAYRTTFRGVPGPRSSGAW